MSEIMGGKVLEYEAKTIRNEGFEKDLEKVYMRQMEWHFKKWRLFSTGTGRFGQYVSGLSAMVTRANTYTCFRLFYSLWLKRSKYIQIPIESFRQSRLE